jgi:hypothetical protein
MLGSMTVVYQKIYIQPGQTTHYKTYLAIALSALLLFTASKCKCWKCTSHLTTVVNSLLKFMIKGTTSILKS